MLTMIGERYVIWPLSLGGGGGGYNGKDPINLLISRLFRVYSMSNVGT